MRLTESLLRRAKLENLERMARAMGIDLTPKSKCKPALWGQRLVGLIVEADKRHAFELELAKLQGGPAPPSVIDVMRDDLKKKGRAA